MASQGALKPVSVVEFKKRTATPVKPMQKKTTPWVSVILPVTFMTGMAVGAYFHSLLQEENSTYRQMTINELKMENTLLQEKALLSETLLGLYAEPTRVELAEQTQNLLTRLNRSGGLEVMGSGTDYTTVRYSGDTFQVPFRWDQP